VVGVNGGANAQEATVSDIKHAAIINFVLLTAANIIFPFSLVDEKA
jgi:hypothetical protein